MINITYGLPPKEKTAVALGYFDGLHRGHMGVIAAAQAQREMKLCIFTFNCDTTLPKFSSPEDIISFEDKCARFEKIGVEYIYAPDFAMVCNFTDEEFVRDILVRKLNAGFACCGRNFRFGLGGHGTPERLCELGRKYGILVEIVEDVCLDGELISSTEIRDLIRRGSIEQANRLLGYDLSFCLPVVHGNEIARTMDYPTINQIIPHTNVIPRLGAYASSAEVDGRVFRAITNIGVRPTVTDSGETVMETHILGYNGDLYGKRVTVSLKKFLRPEKKFKDLSGLKAQIAEDIAKVSE